MPASVSVDAGGGTFTIKGLKIGPLVVNATLPAQYEPSPNIASIDPRSGAPGQLVTIAGSRFRASDTVTFDSAAAAMLGTTPDAHVVVVPNLALGKVSVNVTDTNGHLSTTGPIFTGGRGFEVARHRCSWRSASKPRNLETPAPRQPSTSLGSNFASAARACVSVFSSSCSSSARRSRRRSGASSAAPRRSAFT